VKQWWPVFVLIVSVMLVLSSCARAPAPPTPAPTPTPAPPPDTTPPSAMTSLIAINAYDGRVNLWWDKSTAGDFDHYNVYVSKSEVRDVTAISPTAQIGDISTSNYQVMRLEDRTDYYFAVTAVDKSGNEDKRVVSVMARPTSMPRGTADPDIHVDIYQSDMAWPGTTLLPDNHNPEKPRIIEVNMRGEIIWEYLVPQNLKQYANPGFDVELLPNNNVLFVLPRNGVYEIDRKGKIVWSYLTNKISHDADRLPNGNTIFAFGAFDQKSDAQVTEVNPKGEVVWTWYAKDHFDKPPYKDIYNEGWTHTNAVTRLPNGNTLISPRNFDLMIEVDPQGAVVRTIGEGVFYSTHDPEVLTNGNILAVSQWRDRPHQAIEIDPKTGKIVWQFAMPERRTWPVRDANRLPNGNTLITGATVIIEVTPQGQIVWALRLKEGIIEPGQGQARGFYKAERISAER
jgi:phage terminase large subunit-like protein